MIKKPNMEKRRALFFSFLLLLPLGLAICAGSVSAQEESVQNEHFETYDYEYGGWGSTAKSLMTDHLDIAIQRAGEGSKDEERMARQTLDAALQLEDPEWGGFYRQSITPNWRTPDYQKTALVQARAIRIYTKAYLVLGDPRYRLAAEKTADFIQNFLTSDEGAFYSGQAADIDSARQGNRFYRLSRADRELLGVMPGIDKNRDVSENARLIQALAELYAATSQKKTLRMATAAAYWILENRNLWDEESLENVKSVEGAFRSLYDVTLDSKWLEHAEDLKKTPKG